jgi:hypothetical protein
VALEDLFGLGRIGRPKRLELVHQGNERVLSELSRNAITPALAISLPPSGVELENGREYADVGQQKKEIPTHRKTTPMGSPRFRPILPIR